MTPSDTSRIPIIDFGAFQLSRTGEWAECQMKTSVELLDAFKHHGFVYLKNIPVPPEMIRQAFEWSKAFFDLPADVKAHALHPIDGSAHRGWSPIGLEKVKQDDRTPNRDVQPDQKETFDLGRPDDPQLSNIWLPPEIERAHDLGGIREFFEEFYKVCNQFQSQLLKAISIGLFDDFSQSDYLDKFHDQSENQIRLAHYPSLDLNQDQQSQLERFSSHSDFGTITILFQDQVGGLEVENPTRPGQFIPVPPIQGTVVVNVGDILMRWSNDILRSTLHRVTIPSHPTSIVPARYSIPYFCGPNRSALIECLPNCTDSSNPPKYAPIRADDYISARMRASY